MTDMSNRERWGLLGAWFVCIAVPFLALEYYAKVNGWPAYWHSGDWCANSPATTCNGFPLSMFVAPVAGFALFSGSILAYNRFRGLRSAGVKNFGMIGRLYCRLGSHDYEKVHRLRRFPRDHDTIAKCRRCGRGLQWGECRSLPVEAYGEFIELTDEEYLRKLYVEGEITLEEFESAYQSLEFDQP